MPPSRRAAARVRLIRGAGLASIVGWVAWMAARFQNRPILPASGLQVFAVLAWAFALHEVLRLAGRLTRTGPDGERGYLRAYALALLCGGTFLWYFNAHRVGPLDAQWYENTMTEFLGQSRAGRFPVVVGTSAYTFNGAVHPFRSAPWQFVLAHGIDLATGRALSALAIEHIMAIGSFLAAALVLFIGFSRARPDRRGWAWLFAAAYALSPPAFVPFFKFDMYMTLTAQPVMAAALLCLQRVIDDDSQSAWGWLGVFLAALWYCHPPMALLLGALCGGCAAASVAVRGVTAERVIGAVLCAALFYALAAPYFRSMGEMARSESFDLEDVVLPSLGLAACLFSVCGFLRTRRLSWLGLYPTGILCLHDFAPALVPFAALFGAAMIILSLVSRDRPRGRDAGWTIVCALAAAACAAEFFPGISRVEGPSHTLDMIRGATTYWTLFFRPITPAGVWDQPGFLGWLLIAGMIGFLFRVRSEFARWSAGAAIVLITGLGLCGVLSRFLWENTPWEITSVIGIAYDLRLMPVLGIVAAVGGFFWFTDPGLPGGLAGRVLRIGVAALAVWSLGETAVTLYDVRDFNLSDRNTQLRNRSENVVVERYSWDLLLPPRFICYGVMDPALELRFWGDGNPKAPVIDPDSTERSLEAPGDRPIDLVATPVPTGKNWLTLAPKVELDPGEHRLLRFEFLGNRPEGWLILKGQDIYREYQLPSSGRDYAFGTEPGNVGTLSVWNSGPTHESIELEITGSHVYDPAPGPKAFWRMHSTRYEPARAPIEMLSIDPLHVRVAAPAPGYLESFRSWIPGYKVYVDGKQAAAHESKNALVSVRVPLGTHDVVIRFAGTEPLHTDIRWAEAAWAIAALVGLWTILRWSPLREFGAGSP